MLLAEARDELSDSSSTSVGKKRKMKSVNLDPPAVPAAPVKCYKCSTCEKTFSSPQALGGHMSSAHNNSTFKMKTIHDHDHHDNDNEQLPATRLMMHPPDLAGDHKCKICDKVFPSGQALGGHKRCHWQPTCAIADPPFSSSSSSPAAADASKKPVLDLNLNELPPTDDP